jgi:hypothetical protein
MTPTMKHQEFLSAAESLCSAYAILSRAVAAALPEQLASIAAVDPVTRITLEQFGDPVVRWFRRGSSLSGVLVSDGTIVFDGESILFAEGVAAEHADDLPPGWREQAREVARVNEGTVVVR